VKNLILIFEDEDCFQQNSWHHVTIVIEREQFDVAIHFVEISFIVLLDNEQIKRSKLQLSLGF